MIPQINKKSRRNSNNTTTMPVHDSDSASNNSHEEEYHDERSVSTASDPDHDSSTNSSSRLGQKFSEETKERLAQQETRQVFLLRLLVCVILLAAALAVSLVVYRISIQSEQEQFEVQFLGAATKVTDAFLDIANERLGYAGALVVAIVTHAIDQSDTHGGEPAWPFVTLTSFQRRAMSVKEHSDVLSIGINPIVMRSQRQEWENYTMSHSEAISYYDDSLQYQERLGLLDLDNRKPLGIDNPEELHVGAGGIATDHIYDLSLFQGSKAKKSRGKVRYLPDWQQSPVTRKRAMVNQDRSSNSNGLRLCLLHDAVVFEGLQFSRPGYGDDEDPLTSEIAWLLRMANREPTLYLGDLFSTVYLPLYSDFEEDRRTVGVMRLIIHWARFFRNILPPSIQGVVMVLENKCSEPYTYVLNGAKITPIGVGDLHDPRFDYLEQMANFRNVSRIGDGTTKGMSLHQDDCPITIRVYPSQELYDSFHSNTPIVITISVACVFLFAISMFFVYDRLVERRQKLVLRKAEQTNAIVSSLFPKNVRDRMFEETNNNGKGNNNKADNKSSMFPRSNQAAFQTKKVDADMDARKMGAPIADLFPEATVLFADISGFTAWSSTRDPAQVFSLLQSIYQAFDKIAHKRKVFKVETIGDSYVAVTGLPQPQARHALIMARFAGECMTTMRTVVQDLDSELGPGTADLRMRLGMHSGPVTAGVLMGDRARFQLFGDTVNTASRIESTGLKEKIQASKATADLLIAAGKEHWVHLRSDEVDAKGKGVLTTYWITPWASKGAESRTSSEAGTEQGKLHSLMPPADEMNMKHGRLVDWMTELFKSYVKDIVAKRPATPKKRARSVINKHTGAGTPLDEVVEVIELPEFDSKTLAALAHKENVVVVDESITALLREYISIIASLYHDNPFHNFEHACHVTMSCNKFLKRITTPNLDDEEYEKWTEGANDAKDVASRLHDYTLGISHDPIALFAIVFSALIHDVDHRGVSNAQLSKEDEEMADLYKHKSVAEQNSLDVAWEHLMSDKFSTLRDYLFASPDEMARFREVVVNVVLATDIFDKELNDLRKGRWNKAFSEESLSKGAKKGLRATIVIEHIIQASDVSHTMQHWHVYRKWNKALFSEMTLAFRQGRMGKDPADFWYQGELGFFDNYIIPLAKKLKDCQVFGVSSDECLNYALRNRDEWNMRGKEVVAEMVEELKDV